MPELAGVTWRLLAHPDARRNPAIARALTKALVAERLGVPGATVSLAHLCPTCGSDGHGRPVALVDGSPAPVHVSLSRTRGHAAAAVATAPVGIDVQDWAATEFAGFDDVVVHPDEPRPRTLEERARLWSGKEAVLKLLGTGLDRDPAMVDLGALTRERPGIRLVDLPAPEGASLVLAVREHP